MNDDQTATPARQTRVPASKKKIAWIGGGVAVTVAVAAAVGIPAAAQAQQNAQYESLHADAVAAYDVAIEAQKTTVVEMGSTVIAYEEATALVEKVENLSESKTPIFTSGQLARLASSAKTASEALGDAPEESETRAYGQTVVSENSDEAVTAVNLEDAAVAIVEPVPAAVKQVDGAAVESISALVSDYEDEAESQEQLLKAETERQTAIAEAVESLRPVLEKTGANLTTRAKAVVKKASLASKAKRAAVTSTAKAAAKSAKDEESSVRAIVDDFAAYEQAARAAQSAHTKESKAQAAAASSSEAGYATDGTASSTGSDAGWYDSSSGTWSNTGSGSAASSGGTSSSGGSSSSSASSSGSSSGGSSSSGSSSSGSSSSGSSPATSCPAGTYPTGSWDNVNGVHCLPNGTDEGW